MTDIYGGNTDGIFTEGIRTLEIEDLNQTNDNVKIDLSTANTINLIAPNVLVNGSPIGGGGGGGIQNPLTANLDIGAFDIEGPSLSLVAMNNNIGTLGVKTQNILSATTNNTNIVGTINNGDTSSVAIAPITTSTITSFIGIGAAGSYGVKFTLLKPATIVRIGVLTGSWTNAAITSVVFNFFNEGNINAIYSYNVPRADIYENCYSLLIPSITLPAGTYRYGVGLPLTMLYYNAIQKPLIMNSQLSSVQGAYGSSIGSYPFTLIGDFDFFYSGFMWLIDTTYKIMTPLLQTDKVVINGGTSSQYLMADGSRLQFSANSGNSNFYLYRSDTSQAVNPPSGSITYNNATQLNATIIYISHLTRDNIDIEVFFKQITTLSEVYIQDQNLSEAFMQFNVTDTPTITANNKVAIPVLIRSAGVGITGFLDGHHVLLSFFTNNLETDQRISLVESKTTNISSVSVGVSTQFQGSITASGFNVSGGSLIQRGGRFFSNKYSSITQGGSTGTFNLIPIPIATYITGTNVIPANDIVAGDIYVFKISGKCVLPSGSQTGFIFTIGSNSHTSTSTTNPLVNGNFEVIARWNCCSVVGTTATFSISTIGYMGITGQSASSCVFGTSVSGIIINPTIANTTGLSWYNPTYITCNITVYCISLLKE
jgi:hypothetical protein